MHLPILWKVQRISSCHTSSAISSSGFLLSHPLISSSRTTTFVFINVHRIVTHRIINQISTFTMSTNSRITYFFKPRNKGDNTPDAPKDFRQPSRATTYPLKLHRPLDTTTNPSKDFRRSSGTDIDPWKDFPRHRLQPMIHRRTSASCQPQPMVHRRATRYILSHTWKW